MLAPLPVTTPSNVRPPGAHRSPHRSSNPSSRPSTTVTASSRNLNIVNSLISRLLPPPTTTPTTIDASSSSSSPSDYSFSLVVVVGVGCILLAANIVLFSFVYCRKLKTWKDKSRMKCSHNNHHHHRQLLNQRDQFQQQQQPEREMMNCDSRGEEDDDVSDKIERGSLKRTVKGPNNTAATPALDGNCSSSLYITPIPSHHHLYCQMTALTNSRSMHDTWSAIKHEVYKECAIKICVPPKHQTPIEICIFFVLTKCCRTDEFSTETHNFDTPPPPRNSHRNPTSESPTSESPTSEIPMVAWLNNWSTVALHRPLSDCAAQRGTVWYIKVWLSVAQCGMLSHTLIYGILKYDSAWHSVVY